MTQNSPNAPLTTNPRQVRRAPVTSTCDAGGNTARQFSRATNIRGVV